jgi:glycine cleavage system aminomethyltransferase T
MQSLRRLLCRVSESCAKENTALRRTCSPWRENGSLRGWLMPVQYTSIVAEHQAVRNNAGIFDISHMGQLIGDGTGAREWLNTMLTITSASSMLARVNTLFC